MRYICSLLEKEQPMLKWLLSLITILAINSVLIAQRDSTRLANNATYLEIGGPAGYGSLNYERILVLKKKISLIARCGLSVNHIRDYTNKINPDILIPFSLGACYGSTHKIEAGLGL